MSDFDSIVLALDASVESARGLGCASWLARSLGATLHVLHATAQPLPAADALARLHIPQAQRDRLVVHQLASSADAAILDAVADLHVGLVVMSARGESAGQETGPPQRPSRRLGSVAQAVLERCRAPVLLLPVRYRESLPWTSILAAVSGEAQSDRALEVAVRLAAALHLEVVVVHSGDGAPSIGESPDGAYADAAHHEFPRRIDEMVSRGLASCSEREAHCVRDVRLRSGDPAGILLDEVARHDASVLALGWHGALAPGRAQVLKRLLDEATCALLLVRTLEGSAARLKVGAEIDDEP